MTENFESCETTPTPVGAKVLAQAELKRRVENNQFPFELHLDGERIVIRNAAEWKGYNGELGVKIVAAAEVVVAEIDLP